MSVALCPVCETKTVSDEFTIYGVKVCSQLCRLKKKDAMFMEAYGLKNKPVSVDIEQSKYPTFAGVDLAPGPDRTIAMYYDHINRRVFDAFVLPPPTLDYKQVAYIGDQISLKDLTSRMSAAYKNKARWLLHPAAVAHFKQDRSGTYGLWRADHKSRSRSERKALRRRKAQESRSV